MSHVEPAIDPPPTSIPTNAAPTEASEVGTDAEANEGEQDEQDIGTSDWWRYLAEKLTAAKDWTVGLFRGKKEDEEEGLESGDAR